MPRSAPRSSFLPACKFFSDSTCSERDSSQVKIGTEVEVHRTVIGDRGVSMLAHVDELVSEAISSGVLEVTIRAIASGAASTSRKRTFLKNLNIFWTSKQILNVGCMWSHQSLS